MRHTFQFEIVSHSCYHSPATFLPRLLSHTQGGLDVNSGPDTNFGDLQRLKLVWDDERLVGSLLQKRQLQMLYPLQVSRA